VYAAVRPFAVRVENREHASEVRSGNYDSILPPHSYTPLSVWPPAAGPPRLAIVSRLRPQPQCLYTVDRHFGLL